MIRSQETLPKEVYIFGLIYLIIAMWTLGRGIQVMNESRLSTSWPTVEGKIVKSEVVDGRKTTRADIQFTYIVEGQSYRSFRVKFSQNLTTNYKKANVLAERYLLGSSVTVYYDPADPNTAILEPGVTYYLIRVSLLIFLVPLWLVWVALVVYKD